MYRVVPYKSGSESAKLLATKLSEVTNTTVLSGKPSFDDRNILWGNSVIEMQSMQPTAAIAIAKNKLKTLQKLKEANVSIPEFTTDKAIAEDWIRNEETVVIRKLLNASEGRGIVVATELPIEDAPLYVKYMKKKKEFRVHVMGGQVIDVQEKRRRRGIVDENGNRQSGLIRNIGHDWVFCRENIIEPNGLRDIGIAAVNAIGLLFGAVDIIYNQHYDKLYVLEVNTAPGLTDTTAEKYARAIVELPKFGW